ncbi:MAG: hypothetical protein Q8N51_05635 [Gammaproteobacteria bacterium]|nr:hypothetical protein [Gammaproteobacteria bacterium]
MNHMRRLSSQRPNIWTVITVSVLFVCFSELVAAEDFLDQLMKACSEGDQKACKELDQITEQLRVKIDRLNAQADAFQAEAQTGGGLQTGKLPNLEKAYPIILSRYMSSDAVEPIYRKRGLDERLIPQCAKSFHDLFFIHKKEVPVRGSGEPDWAVIYMLTIDHYYRHCSRTGGAYGAVTDLVGWIAAVFLIVGVVIWKFYSSRKSRGQTLVGADADITKLSKVLGDYPSDAELARAAQADRFLEVFCRGIEEKETMKSQLVELIRSRAALSEIISEFDSSPDELRAIYDQLIYAGVGQWARGLWVPASALCTPETLRYLLENWSGKKLPVQDPTDEMETVALQVLRFFMNDDRLPSALGNSSSLDKR